MKVQMARSGGTFCKCGERAQRSGKGRTKPQQLHTRGALKPGSYLSIGCGFKEAEAVPEALTGQAQLDLLL